CNGRAVGVDLLRRTVAQAAVDQIWHAAREQRVAAGRPCPSCHDLMHEVSSGPSGPAVDVCRVCRFVWFDPTEYEQISPEVLPAGEQAVPDRATEILATVMQFGLIPAQYARYFGLTFLTSFLLHGSFGHLAGNMYFLYVFGDNVEDFLGKARYVGLILIAAVLGDVAHIAMDPRSNV